MLIVCYQRKTWVNIDIIDINVLSDVNSTKIAIYLSKYCIANVICVVTLFSITNNYSK